MTTDSKLFTLINTARDGTHRTGHTGRDTQKTRTSHTPKEPHRPTDAPSPRPDSPSPHTERTPPTDRRTTSTTQLTIPATNQPSTHHPNHQATNPPNPRAQLRRRQITHEANSSYLQVPVPVPDCIDTEGGYTVASVVFIQVEVRVSVIARVRYSVSASVVGAALHCDKAVSSWLRRGAELPWDR